MVENIIVIIIVAGVAFFTLRKLYLIFSGQSTGCACGGAGCREEDGCGGGACRARQFAKQDAVRLTPGSPRSNGNQNR